MSRNLPAPGGLREAGLPAPGGPGGLREAGLPAPGGLREAGLPAPGGLREAGLPTPGGLREAGARRIQLTPGYILHHRPYRDTSRILEVISRDHGRLTLFARGVRGPKARLASILQPFQLLLLSWTGRGEAAQLTGAESVPVAGPPLPAAALMAAFYLNELLLKLTTRHDPLPIVFDTYHETLERLRQGGPLEPELRVFEKRLLEALGYGLDLTAQGPTGKRVDPAEYYHFRPEQGIVATVAEAPGAVAGASLIELASERFSSPRSLEDAKRLLQAALAQCLEGRPLATRAVARAVARGSTQNNSTNEAQS